MAYEDMLKSPHGSAKALLPIFVRFLLALRHRSDFCRFPRAVPPAYGLSFRREPLMQRLPRTSWIRAWTSVP